MIQAIIFDMDGVIVNSEPIHDKASDIVLKKYGIKLDKKTDNEINNEFRGCTEKFFWKTFSKRFGLKQNYKDLIKEKQLTYLDLIKKHTEPVQGCSDLIKVLKTKYKIGLASSSSAKEIDFILTKLKIKKYFDVITSGEFIEKSKPAPDIYLETATKLGVKPKNCLVFEDAVNGVKAAKAAGMKCIAITTSFGKKDLKEADLIIDSFKGFDLKIIEKF